MEGKKYRQSKSKSFHLNYGDAGVEMFNAVTPKQMKEIELLAECVQDIFPRHFVLTEPSTNEYFMFGGSNVTYLTGIFQSVLPDVSRNILHTVQSALKEADWAESRKVFGIRHVYFTSFEGKSLAEHQADLEAAKPKPAFVVLPPEAREQQARDERQKILENRRTEEHRRSKHVQAVPDTSYVVVLQISDRNSFIGGNLLVHHHDAGHGAGRDEDYYDDEEEERLKGQWEAKESVKVPYLVPGQGIEVLTPERGSVVVVPGRKPFGLDAVTHGVRKSLVLELWPFRDAPMGTGRADGTVGRKLGEAGDDKQEL